MQLTPLQLEIQQRADKTLQLWTIISTRYDWMCIYIDHSSYIAQCADWTPRVTWISTNVEKEIVTVYGVPMNWGRLCYIAKRDRYLRLGSWLWEKRVKWVKIENYFFGNIECYHQTVLERPVELQKLVLEFLISLPR